MGVTVREYRPADAAQVADVYRDSNQSLRRSRGGQHSDESVDRLLLMGDDEILGLILNRSHLFVAEQEGTGVIAGIGAVSSIPLAGWLINSAYSASHYVRTSFQHGKAGVSVGPMIRRATLEWARGRGFRKIFGYSTPEAVEYHKKFGAVFHPEYNFRYAGNQVEVHYYEIVLRESPLNAVPLEPYAYRLWRAGGDLKCALLGFLRPGKRRKAG